MKHITVRRLAGLAGLTLFMLALPGLLAAQSAPPPPVDPRFGVIEAFWEAEEAAELSVGWDRILFYWNEIQPTGPDDWNTLHVLEEWLVEAEAQDRVVVGLLKNTPPWATDGTPFSGVPRGLYLPVDDPENLWAGYVRKVVAYYAPRGVHHWIIWNEPEIAPGVYGHEFAGSTPDYYQMIKVAYQVAKEGDPDAIIHLAGWSYWHDPGWLGEFLSVAAADPEAPQNDYFFDVITLHIYFRVETVEELINDTQALQARYGLSKPIWLNETNASPNLDPLWPVERPNFQVDLEQQAWYLIQAHALAFGAEAEGVGVYKLLDILLPPGGESFGILRPDGSRRPAFDAYQTTVRYLGGFAPPVARQAANDFYAFTFERPGEGVTRVLWARRSADVFIQVPALADKAQLITATGQARTVRAFNGFYRVRLHGARCAPACDIGGPPIFLVESEGREVGAPAVPTIAANSVVLATPTVTATPDMTATADYLTTTPTPTTTATATPTITVTLTPSPTPEPSPTPSATPTQQPSPTDMPPASAAVEPVPPNQTDAFAGPRVPVASWMFIGAAVLLAGLLGIAFRRRT